MTLNLKALGLALVAVFAMSTSAASSASAEGLGIFTPEEDAETITGFEDPEHPLAFTVGLGITCATEEFDGHVANGGQDLTIDPTYDECMMGPCPATIDMNACDFTFYNLQTQEDNGYLATVALDCTTGGPRVAITIPAVNCQLTVEPQDDLEHVKFWNTPDAEPVADVDATLTVEGIEVTQEKIVGAAEGCEEKTLEAKYTGGLTFDADNEVDETVGLQISDSRR